MTTRRTYGGHHFDLKNEYVSGLRNLMSSPVTSSRSGPRAPAFSTFSETFGPGTSPDSGPPGTQVRAPSSPLSFGTRAAWSESCLVIRT